MTRKPLNEGLTKGNSKPSRGIGQDGAMKPPATMKPSTQEAKPVLSPPKPAPLPKK